MRREIKVTLNRNDLEQILIDHFKIKDADTELTIHTLSDGEYYFVFTAETAD